MQYQMKISLLILIFCSAVNSCTESTSKKDSTNFVEVETVMDSVIYPNFEISWRDSAVVKFKLAKPTERYPNIIYDSAKIIFYLGYNSGNNSDAVSFFPLNKNGRWISTIKRSITISKTDLHIADSLLGNSRSFDNSSAAFSQSPNYGIVYFKDGNAIGQTSIGPGTQTVKSTFQLAQPSYFGRLNNAEFIKIRALFYNKLHLEDLR